MGSFSARQFVGSPPGCSRSAAAGLRGIFLRYPLKQQGLRTIHRISAFWICPFLPRLVGLFFRLSRGISYAQDLSTTMKTGLAFNGRFWDQLSLDGKIGYVIGVVEGIGEVPYHAKNECVCALGAVNETMKALYGEKADALYIETAQAIDVFFKEPANRRIAVIDAMKYVAKKMSGATKRELEEYEEVLRKSSK